MLSGHFARGVIQRMLEHEPEDRITSEEVVQQFGAIMKPQEVMNNDIDEEQVLYIISLDKMEEGK